MQRNLYLSALKGFAILAIIAIHLLDWSNMIAGQMYPAWIREFLHLFVLFFVSLSGTVIYIAYATRDFKKAASRLFFRGLQIIGIYYIYNIIKFFLFQTNIYPIEAEPFFMMFQTAGIWTWKDILLIHSGSVPLGILVTIGLCVMISPLFLWIAQKCMFPKITVGFFTALAFYFSFLSPLDIPLLYATGYSFFAPLPWLTVFLLGFLMGMIGFDQKKEILLPWLSFLGIISMYFLTTQGKALFPTWYMYPLHWYYIILGFLTMVLLMYIIQIFIQYQEKKSVAIIFNFLETAGNETMYLYIAHWIIIDITLWLNYIILQTDTTRYFIWYTVGLFLLFFIWQKKDKIFLKAQTEE